MTTTLSTTNPWNKQDRRQSGESGSGDGTGRLGLIVPPCRHVPKMSRQVLRTLNHAILLPASDRFYQQQLRILLTVYL